jgi:hypothetical protein
MAAAALDRYPNAAPCRMTAADYVPGAGTGPDLIGAPAVTSWDPPLQEEMRKAGRAVMEERLLDALLADLRNAGGDASR